ncbi:Crp/Fnr family transcriptional regulator [Aequorivita sp. SDUM287046]|uniref:Crp/Fnr family transcriptional regulator n=1 Tax=Aequorivita aurantiaca TaxID=3053356 RepID=A0ABT8DLZ4_9FLAO|nr:Crp/Fnr family transcriptional regulator [Aequorivita aurantiaca]MDN3724253.1 Crp/Fnr family transcriptional regulator [Aequorivita aurantiaca]
MCNQFFNHLNKFTDISESEFDEIISFFEIKIFGKKEILMEAGSICNRHFFVLTGCLQMYYTNEKGAEQTLQFALENWWLTDNLAFLQNRKTEFCIQAVENSEVLCIDFQKQELLLKNFPQLERYFRHVFEKACGAAQMRVKYIFDFSKEEMYLAFRRQFPEFIQRVPQYLIASYLGLTPEYLSEIKSKKFS